MKFIKSEQQNYSQTINYCWEIDKDIQNFSRNHDCSLNERVWREVYCLHLSGPSFKFYDIFNEDGVFVGYFGYETKPLPWLTTFFIMPEFRSQKNQIWSYMTSHLPKRFFSGLFKINTRAISYFQKQGGKIINEIMTEGKPSIVFEFKR